MYRAIKCSYCGQPLQHGRTPCYLCKQQAAAAGLPTEGETPEPQPAPAVPPARHPRAFCVKCGLPNDNGGETVCRACERAAMRKFWQELT